MEMQSGTVTSTHFHTYELIQPSPGHAKGGTFSMWRDRPHLNSDEALSRLAIALWTVGERFNAKLFLKLMSMAADHP
jgi:hypothetical protein